MTTTPEELVNNVVRLISFPEVAIRIHELLADEESSSSHIAAVIETDPALTAALLRIANSARYSAKGNVSTVARAVTVVGMQEVRYLAFGICANTAFEGLPNELMTVEDFWKHSLFCAAAAQELGRRSPARTDDSLFTAGLLHDIGHLVMFNQCPDLSRQALQLSLEENDGLSPYLSERQVLGFDHMAVGAELARQWRLPDCLRECIEFHHEPFASDETTDAVRIVHLANSIAVLAELGSINVSDAPPIDPRVFPQIRLGPDVIPEAVTETQESVAELLRIFVGAELA